MKKRSRLYAGYENVFSEVLFQYCKKEYRHYPELEEVISSFSRRLFYCNPTFQLEKYINEGIYKYEPEE